MTKQLSEKQKAKLREAIAEVRECRAIVQEIRDIIKAARTDGNDQETN